MGAVFIIGALVALIGALADGAAKDVEQNTREETITIETKDKEQDGMYCYGESYRWCNYSYKYTVNGQRVGKSVWDSVEAGKTYLCTLYREVIRECRSEAQ